MDDELRRQNAQLRQDLSEVHDRLAKMTYKYGYVAALAGFAPESSEREIKAHFAGKVLQPKP